MNNNDIESILRDSKPQVKDNPAFQLELQQKMRAVEGIKNEVDRVFMESYKQYLLLPVAGCAIALGMILGRQKAFM